MDDEIQLISDGDGLAVIGDPTAVESFLVSEGLSSKDLGLHRLNSALSAGSAAAQAGSEIAANSGRWMKLTKQSAQLVEKYGLRDSAKGLSTGVLKGKKGQIKGFVEFAKTPGTALTNPAMLAGAAGMMSQLAMQQTMAEITSYLASIDEKVDDVLRAQKDAVLARMIGVGFVVDEAMILRENRGRVDEVTWSKVQGAPAAIAETQAYALRQLDALAEKLESKSNIGDLVTAIRNAEPRAREWLAVLARCFQLQDAIAVLEIDRVLDVSPAEVDGHRLGLKAARQDRLARITGCTERLIGRLDAAAGAANLKVLTHPMRAPSMVQKSNDVSVSIVDFQGRLGIESGRVQLTATRWADAASDAGARALVKGSDGVDTAKRLGTETAVVVRRLGSETAGRAKSSTKKLSNLITERASRKQLASDEPPAGDC